MRIEGGPPVCLPGGGEFQKAGFADHPDHHSGGRVQHYYDRDWNNADVRSTRIVVIGETGFDREAISQCIRG